MSKQTKVCEIIDTFFRKSPVKTGHETLANYSNGSYEPGGINGKFYTHINYHTIKTALLELSKNDKETVTIVETGCSAHGTKSTLLWDKYVTTFGGNVLSVDLNSHAVNLTNQQTSSQTTVTHSDSLHYLPTLTTPIDFLYLDSYDVDFLNPQPSAEHHLKEFNCVRHLLEKGSVVLIDDTPVSPEWLDNGKNNSIYDRYTASFDPNMCGKGSLVNLELEKMGATKIKHQYQSLWIL